jgi:uncharacterized protein (TIGR02145 family)
MKKITFVFAVGVIMIHIAGCKKEKEDHGQIPLKVPVVSTHGVSDITYHSAKGGGEITDDKGSTVTARGICWSINQVPTINDSKTNDGSGAGNFISSISGLMPNTTYYARAYATNSHGTGYGFPVMFNTLESNSFMDSRDGNIYKFVTIGTQTWMAENLKYLPSVVPPGTGSRTFPYYYVHGYYGTNVTDAKATSNYTTYGVLYNWPAAMAGSATSNINPSGVKGVCPNGWHLPSDAEWKELTDYLGGASVAGGKLKETGTTHWNSPNTEATNETGFTALPGGLRDDIGEFYNMGDLGVWWGATESGASTAWHRLMTYYLSNVLRGYDLTELGYSVRCVKD